MIVNRKRNKDYLLIYILASITALINIVFYNNKIVAYAFVGFECILLLYFFFCNKLEKYLAYYAVFLTLALEFDVFVGTSAFYNIKNIRIAGINLGIWLLLPIWLFLFIKPIKVGVLKNRYPVYWKMGVSLIAMNILAAVMGFLMIIFNDNQIRAMGGYISEYIDMAYSFFFLPTTLFIGFSIVLLNGSEKIELVAEALKAILMGSGLELIFSLVFKIRSGFGFGNSTILIVSVVTSFLPFYVLFFGTDDLKKSSVVGICVCLWGLFISVTYNASGKKLITFFLCLITMMLMGKKRTAKKILLGIGIVGVIIVAVMYIFTKSQSNDYLGLKVQQILSLLCFWREDWFARVSLSPKIRLIEFWDIFVEYLHKPYLFITGKGYLGSTPDHSGFLLMLPEKTRGGTFSNEEYLNNSFCHMHEFALLILTFGFPVIIYLCNLVKWVFKSFRQNVWLIVGAYWFILFYGYSFTIGVFGILALYIGLSNLENNKI